jgi:hypothetical protein
VAQFAEQVVRDGHAFEGRTRLELAMQIGRYIPNLNHNWQRSACLHVEDMSMGCVQIYQLLPIWKQRNSFCGEQACVGRKQS